MSRSDAQRIRMNEFYRNIYNIIYYNIYIRYAFKINIILYGLVLTKPNPTFSPGHLSVFAVQRLQFAYLLLVFRLPHFHPDLPRLDVRDVVHDVQLQIELAAGWRRRGATGRVSAVRTCAFAGKRGDRFAPVPAEQGHGRLGYGDDGMPAAGSVGPRRPGQSGQERFFSGRRTGRTLVAQSSHLNVYRNFKFVIFQSQN